MIITIGLDESVNDLQNDKSEDGISFLSLVIEIMIVLELIDQFKQIVTDQIKLMFIDNYGIQYKRKVGDKYLKLNV